MRLNYLSAFSKSHHYISVCVRVYEIFHPRLARLVYAMLPGKRAACPYRKIVSRAPGKKERERKFLLSILLSLPSPVQHPSYTELNRITLV